MHIVVAMPCPWIFRKLSTCMPHANDVRQFATRLAVPGMRLTPSRMTASRNTVS